jgi:TRAP-type mannitol/chloroaromatic compound transport system permease small subunit
MLRQTNIRIDIFYANWSQRTKDIVNLIGLALVWCTVDIIVIIYGSAYAINAYKVNELTASVAYQMPYWPFKGLIIVAYILLLFQAISEIIKILQRLLAKGEKV